ncbi:carbohydrate ABC transporter permease [Paenibacillus psychroresistens]|uniref:Carbohydrate ABC transporter permease n=1 Tax=Paenibacillus psychroresistens TaxID=1778678 RepID=A0A6B8RRE4_9BACL|nr:carbohydrate ABC transporter permease [Paenibacillus psychroresistens]QGQ98384.1 carbohydrate ABC transporter permease [Paenibacillus psychroresistens]
MKYSTPGYRIFTIFNISFMALLGLITVFPYLNVMAMAFNESRDTALGGITVFPREPTLYNFKVILSNSAISQAAIISVLRVVAGTILSLIVQVSAAYAFTKRSLWGRNALLLFLILPMFFNGGIIPQYLLFSKLHLLNHFLIYILPGAFVFYNMLIIRTYMYTIPESLLESAKIDGANEITVLRRIILPLSMPIIATITLWTAVLNWNDWITTLFFITKPKLYTLQFIMMQMVRENDLIASLIEEAIKHGQVTKIKLTTTPEAIKSAQVIITTIPIILVYPFLQKYFIQGVLIGAVKD